MAPVSPPVTITICTLCRAPGVDRSAAAGARLMKAASAAAAGDHGIVIRPTECLSVCNRICAAAISAEGGYTFVFGNVDEEAGAAALVEMARAYRTASFGFVPWKERPATIRGGLIARVPPPDWSPDDGSAPS